MYEKDSSNFSKKGTVNLFLFVLGVLLPAYLALQTLSEIQFSRRQ